MMDGMESGYGQRVWILGMGEFYFFRVDGETMGVGGETMGVDGGDGSWE